MAVIDVTPGQLDPAIAGPVVGRGRVWARRVRVGLPIALIVLVVGGCLLGPVLFPIPQPVGGNVLDSNLPSFSPGHLLGTDPNGNDVLSRLLYGGRSSLLIAVSVNLIGLIVGGGLGALSGYLSGAFDTVIMRLFDMLIAFPSLVLTLAVAQSLGPSLTNTILAISFFSIPATARIARGATLRLRERPFMAAAQLCGTSTWRILFRHVAPNIAPQLVTFGMLGMGIVIVTEGALSFLGLGIPQPAPSWGNMVYEGQQSLSATPMLVVWPSLALVVTVLSFNLLAENLRTRWSGR
jgi:peptide/nickel transport system permease protein